MSKENNQEANKHIAVDEINSLNRKYPGNCIIQSNKYENHSVVRKITYYTNKFYNYFASEKIT